MILFQLLLFFFDRYYDFSLFLLGTSNKCSKLQKKILVKSL